MLRLFLPLLVAVALSSSEKCQTTCPEGMWCESNVETTGDCACLCNENTASACFEPPALGFILEGTEYVGFSDTEVAEPTDKDPEHVFTVNCPEGFLPVRDVVDAALGTAHGWTKDQATHPVMGCRKPCPKASKEKLPGDNCGYTYKAVEPVCQGCLVSLAYSDEKCSKPNEPISQEKKCKFMGKITESQNGWHVHYKRGAKKEVRKKATCRAGLTPIVGPPGSLVCKTPNKCREQFPKVPCYNGGDTEIALHLKSIVAALFTDGNVKAWNIQKDVQTWVQRYAAAGFLEIDSRVAATKKSTASSLLQLQARAGEAITHNQNPAANILKCLGVWGTYYDQNWMRKGTIRDYCTAINGKILKDGLEKTCADKEYQCSGPIKTGDMDNWSNNKAANGMYESRHKTTQQYPISQLDFATVEPLGYMNTPGFFDEYFKSKSAAPKDVASAWSTAPHTHCTDQATAVKAHMQGAKEMSLKGCIDKALEAYNQKAVLKSWVKDAEAKAVELRVQSNHLESRTKQMFDEKKVQDPEFDFKKPCAYTAEEAARAKKVHKAEKTSQAKHVETQEAAEALRASQQGKEYAQTAAAGDAGRAAADKAKGKTTAGPGEPCNNSIKKPCSKGECKVLEGTEETYCCIPKGVSCFQGSVALAKASKGGNSCQHCCAGVNQFGNKGRTQGNFCF